MIPLIIPHFNQFTYLQNMILWWNWYNPNMPIYVIDNASDYQPFIDWCYDGFGNYEKENYQVFDTHGVNVISFNENNCAKNLRTFLDYHLPKEYEYYILSDPDIMIHPNTPPNFLDVFKALIDSGYHHAGFDLIYENLPDWLHDKASIEGNERDLHGEKVSIEVNGHKYEGWKAPIDSTFCMFTTKNSGWYSPMDGTDWGNSVRMFQAFHLPWHQAHPDYLNEEQKHFFSTCKRHIPGEPSMGKTNNIPLEFKQ